MTDLSGTGTAADVLNISSGAIANATLSGAWTATASTSISGYAELITNGYAVDVSAAKGDAGFYIANTGTGASITGSSQADVLVGGTGNDTLSGGNGNDIIYGGGGIDAINVGSSSNGLDQVRLTTLDGKTSSPAAGGGTQISGLNLTATVSDSLHDAVMFEAGTASGAVNFANSLADGADYRFTSSDTGLYSSVSNLAGLSSSYSHEVIRVGSSTESANVATKTVAGLTDAYLVIGRGSSAVDIWYDNNWADTSNRVAVATLNGVSISSIDITDFGIYRPLPV